jgi:hypothetical protein
MLDIRYWMLDVWELPLSFENSTLQLMAVLFMKMSLDYFILNLQLFL